MIMDRSVFCVAEPSCIPDSGGDVYALPVRTIEDRLDDQYVWDDLEVELAAHGFTYTRADNRIVLQT